MKLHPARGVWVEIRDDSDENFLELVAPRKGCVSRNEVKKWLKVRKKKLHPARGVWVEIGQRN